MLRISNLSIQMENYHRPENQYEFIDRVLIRVLEKLNANTKAFQHSVFLLTMEISFIQ